MIHYPHDSSLIGNVNVKVSFEGQEIANEDTAIHLGNVIGPKCLNARDLESRKSVMNYIVVLIFL